MSLPTFQLSFPVPFEDLLLELQTRATEWDKHTLADRGDPERNESRLQALKVVDGARGYLMVNDAPERVEGLRAMQVLLSQMATVFAQAAQRAEDVRDGGMSLTGTKDLPCFRVSGTVLVRSTDAIPTEIPIATSIAANTPERAAWMALQHFSAANALPHPVTEWYDGPVTERIAP
jgi:hypothetical protein